MRVLALQLKRIGDLVLTTPALRALREAGVRHLTLAVAEGCASLLPAIPAIDSTIVFGRGRGWAPWQQALTGGFEAVFDFTGTDRSALATALTRAPRRVTFAWVKKRRLRALAYREFVDSSVRERHAIDHCLDLVGASAPAEPSLVLPAAESEREPFALLHPCTARVEKNWRPERWALVAAHLAARGLRCVVTHGPAPGEREHAVAIGAEVVQPPDLIALATLVARATVVVSCDTAVVHLAAAFQRPQVALFGPTNPFHWRPRHERAAVISAVQPEGELRAFQPKMAGAPMERIETPAVIAAIERVLKTETGRCFPS